MNNFRKLALIGMATAGIAAIALPVFAKQSECHAQHRDAAKMSAMIQKRQTELHAKLKLNAEQESAWKAFSEKMTPAGNWGKHGSCGTIVFACAATDGEDVGPNAGA